MLIPLSEGVITAIVPDRRTQLIRCTLLYQADALAQVVVVDDVASVDALLLAAPRRPRLHPRRRIRRVVATLEDPREQCWHRAPSLLGKEDAEKKGRPLRMNTVLTVY